MLEGVPERVLEGVLFPGLPSVLFPGLYPVLPGVLPLVLLLVRTARNAAGQ